MPHLCLFLYCAKTLEVVHFHYWKCTFFSPVLLHCGQSPIPLQCQSSPTSLWAITYTSAMPVQSYFTGVNHLYRYHCNEAYVFYCSASEAERAVLSCQTELVHFDWLCQVGEIRSCRYDFIAHNSFLWTLQICLHYKCVPYLTQSVFVLWFIHIKCKELALILVPIARFWTVQILSELLIYVWQSLALS